jgi:hypothetical protein
MNKLLLCFLFFTLLLGGCQYSNYTYIQTPLNIPHLKKKGDAQVDLYGSVKGLDLQSSYAVSDRLGLMVNVNASYKVLGLDVAAGYFKVKFKHTWSLYGGLGMGDLAIAANSGDAPFTNTYYQWDNASHYQKIYLQPSFLKNVSERFSYGIALRANYVRFASYSYKHLEWSGSDERRLNEYLDTVETHSPALALIFDPVITFNFLPEKRFSFHAQVGYSFSVAYGELSESHSINMTGYHSSNRYVAESSEAASVAQPVYFPFSIYGGIRFKIKR